MVMAMNSEYRGSASGVAAPKKKTATRKTVVTPGTKVSQATIDKVKAMGMTKALKGAANASPEMREALKRLYGAKRVAAAGGSSKPAARSADAARAAATKGVTYKSADAARNAAMKADAARKKPTVRIPSAAGFGATNMPNKNTKPGNFGTGSVSRAGTTLPKRKPATNPAAQAVVSILSGQGLRGNNSKTPSQVAATNAKRMGISVAEYNRRLAAKKK